MMAAIGVFHMHSTGSGKGIGQQSAVEMMMVYSWAILIMALMVSVAFILSFSSSTTSYIPSVCYMQALFACQDTLLSGPIGANQITYTVIFLSKLQGTVYFPSNSFNVSMTNVGAIGKAYNVGNCTPSMAQPGAEVTCTENVRGGLQPPAGSQINSYFTIKYATCQSSAPSSCTSASYITSGWATQSYTPQSAGGGLVGLYNITLNTLMYNSLTSNVGAAGYVLLNGAPYSNGTRAYLLYGNYVVYAQPPAGDSFAQFNALSGGITLSSNTPSNGVAVLYLPKQGAPPSGKLLVQFTEAQCYVCNYSAGAATPFCPPGCPTVSPCPAPTTLTTSTTTSTTSTVGPTTTIGYYQCEPTCNVAVPGYRCPTTCPLASVCTNSTSSVECLPSTGFEGAGGGAGAAPGMVNATLLARAMDYLVTITVSTVTTSVSVSTVPTSTSTPTTIAPSPLAWKECT